jgi:lactate racemase
MKALEFSRKPARYAAAMIAGALKPGAGAAVGPLRLRDLDEPELPADGWVALRPRLSGICGSDLSTIDGHSSRYFEPIVSFPFVPGHEVVGDVVGGELDGRRAVLVPVLHCEVRGIDPACPACQAGDVNRCERIAFGHLEPGLQSGFCEDTGGGWSEQMAAHPAQLVAVPDELSDEAAVMVEPAACAVHAAQVAAALHDHDHGQDGGPVVVIGAGTLGLLTIAALPEGTPIVTGARYPHQKRLATELGATTVVSPDELNGAVRLATGSMKLGRDHASGQLAGGARVVVDCVGSEASLAQALEVVAPGGTILVVGMPSTVSLDLTGLWHREVALRGVYAYRREDFDTALHLVSVGRPPRRPRPARLGHLPAVPLRGRHRPRRRRRPPRRRQDRVRSPEDLRTEALDASPWTRPRRRLVDAPDPVPPRRGLPLEKLPAGRSRVIYPPEPHEGLKDPDAAIRHALEHPLGDSEPLSALLFSGMKLTICFDDISLPLPPMKRPDVRQRVIEAVLDSAAAAGVDDVEIIAALALHRRMTEDELRHAVGDRVYDAFAPSGKLYNHDAEDPDGMLEIGTTDHGELVEINKRAATSDLIVYVNINLVSMDGGWKSTATGLSGYRSLRHHHNVHTMQHSKSFMDRHRSELHHSNWRMGKVLRDGGVKIFQIETTVNNDTFGTFALDTAAVDAAEARVGVDGQGPGVVPGDAGRAEADAGPGQAGRVPLVEGALRRHLGAGRRGRGRARADRERLVQHLVPVEGQTDVLTMGLPYICPYNVNSMMNPILVMCLGLGYFFNLYRGKPAGARGRRADHEPPDAVGVPPGAPPELHRLLRAGAGRDHRPDRDRAEVREALRRGRVVPPPVPHQLRLPRRPPVLHVVLGQPRARAPGPGHHRRRRPKAVRRLGFQPASTLQDALEMASDVVGRQPTITHLHNPPILMADDVS